MPFNRSVRRRRGRITRAPLRRIRCAPFVAVPALLILLALAIRNFAGPGARGRGSSAHGPYKDNLSGTRER